MAFRWRADSGTTLHAYWEVGGQWAKYNGFIKWFDPLIYAAVHSSLSWTISATFDACFCFDILCYRMLCYVRILLMRYNEHKCDAQHAHSRTAVRNSRTERAMHAFIIWYIRAKT